MRTSGGGGGADENWRAAHDEAAERGHVAHHLRAERRLARQHALEVHLRERASVQYKFERNKVNAR